MRTFILILLLSFPFLSFSQEGFPLNGVEDNRKNYYAFTNAKIFVDYKNVIESGTLIIKNGKIISVGKDIDIPDGVRTFDLYGSYVYPSFVDLYTDYAIVKNKRGNTEITKINPFAHAKVKLDNEASLRLFEKCGFKKKFYLLEK